jgi:hypothetical protein
VQRKPRLEPIAHFLGVKTRVLRETGCSAPVAIFCLVTLPPQVIPTEIRAETTLLPAMRGARGVIGNYSDHAHAQFLLAAMDSLLRVAFADINIAKVGLYITSWASILGGNERERGE